MNTRTTQVLLAAIVGLLAAQLVRPWLAAGDAVLADEAAAAGVLRAQVFELVNKGGQVVAQLHLGEDGGGSLRLRSADGVVRVKLGATADGSGLILFDKQSEPALWLASNQEGTSVTLAEKGKEKKVLRP